jgi:hypothetical protein
MRVTQGNQADTETWSPPQLFTSVSLRAVFSHHQREVSADQGEPLRVAIIAVDSPLGDESEVNELCVKYLHSILCFYGLVMYHPCSSLLLLSSWACTDT